MPGFSSYYIKERYYHCSYLWISEVKWVHLELEVKNLNQLSIKNQDGYGIIALLSNRWFWALAPCAHSVPDPPTPTLSQSPQLPLWTQRPSGFLLHPLQSQLHFQNPSGLPLFMLKSCLHDLESIRPASVLILAQTLNLSSLSISFLLSYRHFLLSAF